MTEPSGTALAHVGEFGPYDALADRAHRLYLDGYAERAVRACREGLVVTRGGGDLPTTRFLRYIEGVALQGVGRHREAVTVALDLLRDVDDEPDLMWRAKTLALLAQSSNRVQEVSRALDALAEGAWLVAQTRPGRYSHVSASMAVAHALRAVYLFEQSDDVLAGICTGEDLDLGLQVEHERALLSALWATTLLLVGDEPAAGAQLVRCAERSLRMRRIALLVGDGEMAARAESIEAYATSRLGATQLAVARARAASGRFRRRDELVETHLVRLVLGEASALAGDLGEARRQFDAAQSASARVGRDIWTAAAVEALAGVEVAENGSHPGLVLWRNLARAALGRVWAERESRFAALQVRNQVRALTLETDRMGQVVLLDPLTGLGNRRMLAGVVERAGPLLSAVFVDVDDFKLVNDRFSHEAGDEVLRRLAVILSSHCRSGDVLVRYGGDEFVILVFAGSAAAQEVASRLLHAVRSAPWSQVAPGLAVTVSVGVGQPATARGAIAAADAALYAAKRAGRDGMVTV
ncbi:GGDEF domain-containing protein [Pengzhenrongella sicca]|uniref:GGDEF domain-containing protein n=1 Tax=Pengzhenrongella sicca TaxID=2819238 RepID=A0A8A4ZJI2_9MICO|nr:GGDEF domain-containing protein [Pengzhenrongella sicca]QTE29758.1 GGDEF domain-containing protein [Pengzhenrongella sicca]